MRWLVSLLLISAGPLLAVDDPKDDANKKDMKALEGEWKLVSRDRDGKADGGDDIKDLVMANTADKFEVKGGPSAIGAMKGGFTIDATKKPKHMDRTPADGPNKDKTFKGIYELDGDTLKICIAPPGKDRPMEFTSKAGTGHILAVFKREKK